MDTEATLRLERDPARELYQNWQGARVRAVRQDTTDGKTYADFRLVLPISAQQFPLGLSENPFTGEKLDRYGARVPSTSVGPDLVMRNLTIQGVFPALVPLLRRALDRAGDAAEHRFEPSHGTLACACWFRVL